VQQKGLIGHFRWALFGDVATQQASASPIKANRKHLRFNSTAYATKLLFRRADARELASFPVWSRGN
jgi:hypothetical protein